MALGFASFPAAHTAVSATFVHRCGSRLWWRTCSRTPLSAGGRALPHSSRCARGSRSGQALICFSSSSSCSVWMVAVWSFPGEASGCATPTQWRCHSPRGARLRCTPLLASRPQPHPTNRAIERHDERIGVDVMVIVGRRTATCSQSVRSWVCGRTTAERTRTARRRLSEDCTTPRPPRPRAVQRVPRHVPAARSYYRECTCTRLTSTWVLAIQLYCTLLRSGSTLLGYCELQAQLC